MPLSEHSFIKMLWQAMQLLLNNWVFGVVDLIQQESLPPSSAPLAWLQSLWAFCWHIQWEIVWLYLQGKWFFAAVWLLNRSYFIRCFCCTVKNCLLLSTDLWVSQSASVTAPWKEKNPSYSSYSNNCFLFTSEVYPFVFRLTPVHSISNTCECWL